VVAAVLATVLAGACGGGGGTGAAVEKCSVLFANGKDTLDLGHQPRCVNAAGKVEYVASAAYKCTDGPRLFANKYGYGVKGKPWHTDDALPELQAPDPASPIGKAITTCRG